jgi:hypothetical protein
VSSNTSQRKAQATILASTPEDLSEWWLLADCGQCGPRAVPVASLPAGLTVFRVLARMRCRACGGGVAAASIDNVAEGWRRRVVKVWGPGSYG